jgi:hypothetical protein
MRIFCLQNDAYPYEKTPLRVGFLGILVVWLAIWNGLRLGEAIFFWKTLENYGAHPVYIAISGAVWIISGLLLAWGLWLGKAWAWATMLGITAGYTAWYWFDRLVMQEPHANWLFVLIINIILLLLIFATLFSHQARSFFQRDAYERKSETPTITGS